MNVIIISASQRLNSQTLKVSKYLKLELENKNIGISLIDLAELNLPFIASEEAKIITVFKGCK